MIIRAKVTTNSSEDKFARVKVEVPEQVNEFGPIESVNGIPLKKGDTVYLDISNGYECALILGKAIDSTTTQNGDLEGSVLFESSNGSDWFSVSVKNNVLKVITSDNNKIEISKDGIVINDGKNGGLVNIESLNKYLSTLERAISAGLNAAPSGGGAPAFEGAMISASTVKNNLEDVKIKH